MKANSKSQHEAHLAFQIKASGLPAPVPEYLFAEPRKFRFDFAWPSVKVALEIEGGIYVQGRHSRGAGMEKDMEKYNLAAEAGWRVLRFSPKHVKDGSAIRVLRSLLERAP